MRRKHKEAADNVDNAELIPQLENPEGKFWQRWFIEVGAQGTAFDLQWGQVLFNKFWKWNS